MKKKIIKIKKIFTICTLLAILFACNDDKVVEFNTFNSFVTYTHAKGYYWGGYLGSGTANFQLWLYSDVDEKVGIVVEGYTSLPPYYADFNLETRSYLISNTREVGTILHSDKDLVSYAFNENTNKFLIITGGSFNVEITSGRNNYYYNIETNFSGRENLGNGVEDIRVNFTGPIEFEIIPRKYSAIGFELFNNQSLSWSGDIFSYNDDTGLYYSITNWANSSFGNYPIWIDLKNEKLILDGNTSVGDYEDYKLYYKACYFTQHFPNGLVGYVVPNYEISYNKNSQTLDFSGTNGGDQIYVGLWGVHNNTGEMVFFSDTQVRDAKLFISNINDFSNPDIIAKTENNKQLNRTQRKKLY
ncbi:MAG: hypothetical protein FWH18_02050 [Marinilabiliaceae bacterium]|nr:hypothetical protein [Marinilabiliaceae bacterium]